MSITNKLKLKDGLLYLLQAPENCKIFFADYHLKTTLTGKEPVQQVLLFTPDKKAIDTWVPKLLPRLDNDALLWIAYPKKTSKLYVDISRDNGWNVLMEAGYDGVAQIAIDNDWSALRFRENEQIGTKLRDIPMSERKTDGVDYVNKTVELPADAIAALKKHKGIIEFFNSLAFSHKKEYAEAIADAKKEETRIRRIEKMAAALLKMKAEKEQKKK